MAQNFIQLLSMAGNSSQTSAANCIGAASCKAGLKPPLNTAGLAPWVVCSFKDIGSNLKGNNIAVTVGSFDPATKDEGLIKSFHYGWSDGMGCKLEVTDRKGSDLSVFFQRLNKAISKGNQDFQMRLRWGWSASTGGCAIQEKMPVSGERWFLPTSLLIKYVNGGFHYTLEGSDTLQSAFQVQNDNIYPEGGGKMKLKDAVIKLWKDTTPSVEVSFKRRTLGTKTMEDIDEPFVNSSGQPVVGTWHTKGMNAMSVVVEWKAPFKTDKGYGLKPIWNNSGPTPHIMYVESGCKAAISDKCEQAYIVNGGKHSPVISFNPNIAWTPQIAAERFGGGAGSTATGASQSRNASTEDNDCIVVEATKNAGIRTALPPTEQGVENEGPENAQRASDEGMNAQTNANKGYSQPYNAELIVQGDPEMDSPFQWWHKYISIVVVNPFHPVLKLTGGSGQIKDADWLASPICNPILTSKSYRIEKVSHDIKEGSYTTTISVARDPDTDEARSAAKASRQAAAGS